MFTKEQLLTIYKNQGKEAQLKREKMFLDQQTAGIIPSDIDFNDENYADYIGMVVAALPSPETANEYLKNVFNKLALIDFSTITGNRNELFMKAVQPYVPYGDSIEIIYTDLRDTSGYDITKFIPDATVGGDVVYSQRIQLSSVAGTSNPDKIMLDVVVPTLLITQALNGAIQTGLANG